VYLALQITCSKHIHQLKGKTTMAKKLTDHERALAAIKVAVDHPKLGWFEQFKANFERWGVERVGTLPTPAMITVATVTCKKTPGIEAVNVAMALRAEGVMVSQYLNAAGAEGAAHNHLKALVNAGLFDPIARGAKVKRATITGKGAAEIDRLLIAHGFKAAPKVKAGTVKVSRPRNKKAAPVTDTVVGTLTVRPTSGDDTITVDVLQGSDGSIAVDTHGDSSVTVDS
jgi:hypothetical protein